MKLHDNLIPIIVLILTITLLIKNEGFATIFKTSKHNNKSYEVQDVKDSQQVANLMGKIELKINKFTKYLIDKYPNDERIIRLQDNLEEIKYKESPFEKGTSSYTINKGELMSICLRQKNALKEIHDLNTLMFVVIHELGHVMTLSTGHTQEWMNNFRFLLKEAEQCGIYNPVDYSEENINYCGVDVTHNPYYNSD